MKRRYVYRLSAMGEVECIEVSSDYQRHADRQPVFTDRYMEGVRSPVDGTDIGSRTKRREHMRAHGLVDADDFKGEWAKAREKREALRAGDDGIDWGKRLQETAERMRRGK